MKIDDLASEIREPLMQAALEAAEAVFTAEGIDPPKIFLYAAAADKPVLFGIDSAGDCLSCVARRKKLAGLVASRMGASVFSEN